MGKLLDSGQAADALSVTIRESSLGQMTSKEPFPIRYTRSVKRLTDVVRPPERFKLIEI